LYKNYLSYYFGLLSFFAIPNLAASDHTEPLNKIERYTKINEYLSISKQQLRMDSQKSFEAAKKARELSLDFDDAKLIAADLCLSKIFQQKGMLDTAHVMINNALTLAQFLGNDTLVAEAHHAFGMNYQYGGKSELAIESYNHALKINENLNLSSELIRQLNNIGLVYRDEEQYDLALEYLDRCLRISRAKGFKKIEYYSYGNIGYILMKQNKLDEALERFENTLKLTHLVYDTVSYCTINYLIADVKLQQKEYAAAKDYATKALNVAKHIDYVLGKVFCNRIISDVYRNEKNYEEARRIALLALQQIKNSSSYLYYEDVLNVLYAIEYETGNFKRALEFQTQLFARKDSLKTVEIKEKIANSAYRHQLLKNEQENRVLKLTNESTKRISFLAMALAILASLLVLLSYFAYRKSKDYNKTLKKAIEERTKELEESNKHLAKSNEELERFAYIASHDLKTPLRDIVSFTGLLERQLQSHQDEKVHEYLSFIKKGGRRLNNLIIDTLEYSRLSYFEENKQDEKIDLREVIHELLNSMSNYIEAENAKILVLDNLPFIKANYSSIVLLFQNLIENSIKYNDSKEPILKVYAKQEQNFVSIYFEDNGIGIPKEYHDEVFVMFSRLHNQNEYEGSGLGLAICNKVVKSLNGEIDIQSEKGKGSIFKIRFPSNLITFEKYNLN